MKKLAYNSIFEKLRSWRPVPSLHGKCKVKSGTAADFIFLSSKITVDGDCSHEITIPAPWKESYDRPRQRIKRQTYITLLTKICIVKAMVFPVVMYRNKNWTIKKTKPQRTDAFKLWF